MVRLPTKPQAEVAQIFSEIIFKAVALIVLLLLLVVGFGVFIYTVIKGDRPLATTVLGGVDMLLGLLLKQVYSSLFPAKTAPP